MKHGSKRMTDMQAQLPEVHSMLTQFLKLKYRTFRPRGWSPGSRGGHRELLPGEEH